MRADRCVFCERESARESPGGAPRAGKAAGAPPVLASGPRGSIIVASLGMMAATSAVMWLAVAPTENDEPVSNAVSTLAAEERLDSLDEEAPADPSGFDVEALEEPAAAPEPSVVVPSEFVLRFEGRARSAGMDVKRRAKCVVEAQIGGEHVRRVTLTCDDAPIYDSETPMSGFSSRGSDLLARHEGSEARFALDYYDVGQRVGRPSIRVSSVSGSAEVFDVLQPGAMLTIAIDELGTIVPSSD
jgi:hypothetical protein